MPVSFILAVGVVTLLVLIPATLKLAGFVLGRRRQLCPGCSRKALAMTGGAIAARIDENAQDSATWAEYECDHCNAQFVKPLGTGFMTRQAWISGAKEPIPTAVLIERADK
ncbi:MAG: hypothetical protein H0T42_04590 [Deltaproteobacteria bacterium]|nr:hypothetical protein [Deltaproteobacteria bacterium]